MVSVKANQAEINLFPDLKMIFVTTLFLVIEVRIDMNFVTFIWFEDFHFPSLIQIDEITPTSRTKSIGYGTHLRDLEERYRAIDELIFAHCQSEKFFNWNKTFGQSIIEETN